MYILSSLFFDTNLGFESKVRASTRPVCSIIASPMCLRKTFWVVWLVGYDRQRYLISHLLYEIYSHNFSTKLFPGLINTYNQVPDKIIQYFIPQTNDPLGTCDLKILKHANMSKMKCLTNNNGKPPKGKPDHARHKRLSEDIGKSQTKNEVNNGQKWHLGKAVHY